MTHSGTRSFVWLRAYWLELLVALLLLTVLSIGAAPFHAAEPALPSGEKVLDDYLKATGSKKARKKLNNRVTVASLDLAAQGVSLGMTIHSARPNRNYTVIESELTGKIEKGTDGEIVWETSDMMGAQIKEGQERIDFLREANFDRFAAWRELYTEARCTGIKAVDERPAHELVLTPVEGKPQTMYFDVETKLLVKHVFVLENPMGSLPLTSYIGDYREVDGVLLPFEVKAVVMGQERMMKTESIAHNVDLPADRFDLPQSIRDLLDGSRSDAGDQE